LTIFELFIFFLQNANSGFLFFQKILFLQQQADLAGEAVDVGLQQLDVDLLHLQLALRLLVDLIEFVLEVRISEVNPEKKIKIILNCGDADGGGGRGGGAK
jgi:hypothetical protein